MADKIFTNGLIFKLPREKAPEYVKGSLAFKVEEFIKWLQENVDDRGWVNVDLKVSRNGKPYAEKNTWKPGDRRSAGEETGTDKTEDEMVAERATSDEAIPF